MHRQINQALPKIPNWKDFLAFLKNEEDNCTRIFIENEIFGIKKTTSLNFVSKYLPPIIKKFNKKEILMIFVRIMSLIFLYITKNTKKIKKLLRDQKVKINKLNPLM